MALEANVRANADILLAEVVSRTAVPAADPPRTEAVFALRILRVNHHHPGPAEPTLGVPGSQRQGLHAVRARETQRRSELARELHDGRHGDLLEAVALGRNPDHVHAIELELIFVAPQEVRRWQTVDLGSGHEKRLVAVRTGG